MAGGVVTGDVPAGGSVVGGVAAGGVVVGGVMAGEVVAWGVPTGAGGGGAIGSCATTHLSGNLATTVAATVIGIGTAAAAAAAAARDCDHIFLNECRVRPKLHGGHAASGTGVRSHAATTSADEDANLEWGNVCWDEQSD